MADAVVKGLVDDNVFYIPPVEPVRFSATAAVQASLDRLCKEVMDIVING